ncbi:hypothetical protein ACFL0V_04760 [Nanoarchaeota archaeon]
MMKRKAQAMEPTHQLMGLVLGAIIIIGTVSMFYGFMKIFINPPSGGSAKGVFDTFDIVTAFKNPKQKNTSCFYYNFFVEENWAFAGFHANGETSYTESITCGPAKDCIEERCGGAKLGDVKKPPNCGSGPCVCVCYKGDYGDLSSDNCYTRGAVCKPIDANIGIKKFKRTSRGYCTATIGVGAVGVTYKADFCDLIYDGETCGVGSSRGLQYGVLWREQGEVMNFMFLSDEAERKKYPSAPNCRKMLRDMKRVRPPPRQAAPAQQSQGPAVTQAVDAARAQRRTAPPSSN